VLGYLDPNYFLGGRMKLDLDGARSAIKHHIADKLKLSVEEAAWGIHQIANENMANAARVHTLERGKDPHRLPVFAFGGAGPVHAYRIAKSLGSPSLLVPFGAGVTSTIGFLSAPLAFDFVRTWRGRLESLDWNHANALLAEMEQEGEALLTASGVTPDSITHRREADMRYIGQGHEIRVPLPNGELNTNYVSSLVATFQKVYQELYERLGPPVAIEVMNWRVVSSGPNPKMKLHIKSQRQRMGETIKAKRIAYFPEASGFVMTPIYDRYKLAPEDSFDGPAIVEERESTVIVGPGAKCRIDANHNLVVQLNE
jgi:N-methylhydantoinase A